MFAPRWETTSGGVRVMYGLYGWLLAKGQVAFMNQYQPNTSHVAIYPEIYAQEDTTNADKVVRYVLQKPATVSAIKEDGTSELGPSEFDESEDIYAFSRMYYPGLPDKKYMFLPILDTHLFTDRKLKRTEVAYIVGKGMNGGEHPQDAIPIDRSFAQDQEKLADLLNRCKVLYVYDPVSAIMEVARLCGCPVIFHPKGGWFTKEEYMLYEPGMMGISFESNKIPEFNSNNFRLHYMNLRSGFEKKLDKFIEDTQK